jgi:3D (Asp-Asp-Asp) domain-containing protein
LVAKAPASDLKRVRVRLTFYSGKDDQWGSRVAWQKVDQARLGRTVAADPTLFPYGTWIHIPGFGKRRVEDTGTAVKARTASASGEPVIDVYVGSETEVARLGACMPEYVEIMPLGASRRRSIFAALIAALPSLRRG